LFKKLQRADKKAYLLLFKDKDRPLNGNCARVSKPKDMPCEYDEMQKFTSGAIYGKWLIVHDIPMDDIVDQMIKTFWCEKHQVYLRYLQYEEAVDAGLFIYSHWNLEADSLTSLLSNMSGYHMAECWKAISSGHRWSPPMTDKNVERPQPQ
jgi:hypothetical protein